MSTLKLFLVTGFLLSASELSAKDVNLVPQAVAFAAGKIYQGNPPPSPAARAAGRYDCTTYVQSVLANNGFAVAGPTSKMLNIVLSHGDKAQLVALVTAKDKKIKGVVAALVDSQQGTEITSLAGAKPGDIIQMWKVAGGQAHGHTGFIKEIKLGEKKVELVGAHNSTDGIGVKWFTLGENGYQTYFIIRPQK